MSKIVDAMRAETLTSLIAGINNEGLTKEDIIQIFATPQNEFVVVYYK